MMGRKQLSPSAEPVRAGAVDSLLALCGIGIDSGQRRSQSSDRELSVVRSRESAVSVSGESPTRWQSGFPG